MRKPDPDQLIIPPCAPGIFPHRDFPPWIALTHVFDQIGDLVRRQRVPSELERLQVPLIDASERIVEAASGDLPVQRWHRRLATSIRLCQRAEESLAEYASMGAMTPAEAKALSAAIDEVVRRLTEAWTRAELPDEVRSAMPALPLRDARPLH
jgi:hypothetical protein